MRQDSSNLLQLGIMVIRTLVTTHDFVLPYYRESQSLNVNGACELLTGENQYYCSRYIYYMCIPDNHIHLSCDKLSDAQRENKIVDTSDILLISLNRYRYTYITL